MSRSGGNSGYQIIVQYVGTTPASGQSVLCASTNAVSELVDTISVGSGTQCGGDDHNTTVSYANLGVLLTHEMGHAIGFAHYAGSATDNCIMNLDAGLHTSPCAHEIYALAHGYGVYTPIPYADQLIVATTFSDMGGYTSMSLSSSSAMIGDTVIASIPTLYARLDGSGVSGSGTATSSGDGFSWSPGSGTGPADTVQLTGSGSVRIAARLTSKSGWLAQIVGDSIVSSVTVAAVPAPTAVTATVLDTTHVVVAWTNGSGISGAGGGTRVQLLNGATVVSTDSFGLTRTADTVTISPNVTYTAQVQHVHNGYAGSWVATSPFVTNPEPVATYFFIGTTCVVTPSTLTFQFIWGSDPSPVPSGWNWQIALGTATTAPALHATILDTGSGGFVSDSLVHNKAGAVEYYWIRYASRSAAGSWTGPWEVDQYCY